MTEKMKKYNIGGCSLDTASRNHGSREVQETVETRPYVILRASLPTILMDVVNKHIGWGYKLHGETFREGKEWFQIVSKE